MSVAIVPVEELTILIGPEPAAAPDQDRAAWSEELACSTNVR
jgi:hypothetical protein